MEGRAIVSRCSTAKRRPSSTLFVTHIGEEKKGKEGEMYSAYEIVEKRGRNDEVGGVQVSKAGQMDPLRSPSTEDQQEEI